MFGIHRRVNQSFCLNVNNLKWAPHQSWRRHLGPVVLPFQLTGTEIGRRDRPGRVWRKARRLSHELLSDFADLQLQALFAGKDVAVGHLDNRVIC